MFRRLRTIIDNARFRGKVYVSLLGWLFSIALKQFAWRIFLSSISTASSIACQGFSFGIIVGAVGQLQTSGRLTSFPGIDRLGIELAAPNPNLVIAVFVVLFFLGGALNYASRSIAIRLDSRVYRYFFAEIGAYFGRKTEVDTALLHTIRTRVRIASKYSVLRVLNTDARFAGVIVRLGLYNISHLGSIAIGLSIIALYAPLLLPLIGLFALFAAFMTYPLNLRATRTTRMLEVQAPKRSAAIREKVNNFLAGNSAPEVAFLGDDEMFEDPDAGIDAGNNARGNKDDEENEAEIISGFHRLVENRLLVLESSRIVMSSMVGVGIGFLVWLMFSEQHQGMVSYSSLLVLFFGLRFVMNGLEGLMVTVTSVNRFLPHLIRLHELMREIDGSQTPPDISASRGASQTSVETPPSPSSGNQAVLNWGIETGGLQATQGDFLAGGVYAMLGPTDPGEASERQMTALTNTNSDVIFVRATGVDVDALSERERSWLTTVMEGTGSQNTSAENSATDSAMRAELPNYLCACLEHARRPPALLLLEGAYVYELSATGIAAIRQLFPTSAICIVSDSLDKTLAKSPARDLFVSDGKQIVCAVDMKTVNSAAGDFIRAICHGDWRDGRRRYEAPEKSAKGK